MKYSKEKQLGKSTDQNKEEKVEFRCTTKEKNRIKVLASTYSDGNISRYILSQCLDAPRKIMSK